MCHSLTIFLTNSLSSILLLLWINVTKVIHPMREARCYWTYEGFKTNICVLIVKYLWQMTMMIFKVSVLSWDKPPRVSWTHRKQQSRTRFETEQPPPGIRTCHTGYISLLLCSPNDPEKVNRILNFCGWITLVPVNGRYFKLGIFNVWFLNMYLPLL